MGAGAPGPGSTYGWYAGGGAGGGGGASNTNRYGGGANPSGANTGTGPWAGGGNGGDDTQSIAATSGTSATGGRWRVVETAVPVEQPIKVVLEDLVLL